MALYAIGDLHLHFQTEVKAKNQIKDRVWKNHEVKFRKNCEELIHQEDTSKSPMPSSIIIPLATGR